MNSAYEIIMESVRTMIKGVNDIKSANKVLEEYGKIDFPYNSKQEAWTMLKNRVAEIGLKYSHELKGFETV